MGIVQRKIVFCNYSEQQYKETDYTNSPAFGAGIAKYLPRSQSFVYMIVPVCLPFINLCVSTTFECDCCIAAAA